MSPQLLSFHLLPCCTHLVSVLLFKLLCCSQATPLLFLVVSTVDYYFLYSHIWLVPPPSNCSVLQCHQGAAKDPHRKFVKTGKEHICEILYFIEKSVATVVLLPSLLIWPNIVFFKTAIWTTSNVSYWASILYFLYYHHRGFIFVSRCQWAISGVTIIAVSLIRKGWFLCNRKLLDGQYLF